MSPSGPRPASAVHAEYRAVSVIILALAQLSSCARGPSAPPAAASSTATPVTTGPTTIHFALIGTVTNANVWSLFDKQGYSYNNYAVRSSYWPRLYTLSIPEHQFEAVAAAAMPSPVRQEGTFYTATVPLRTDLAWSDGAPFTAEDVAFTVNAALEFQLGFDWASYYDPLWLDHVEAMEPHTAKFFFKQMPNVGVWQYGALQGPLVQRGYWASKIVGPAALLPSAEVVPQIQSLKEKIASLQQQLGALNLSTYTTLGEEARQTQAGLKRQQGDLDEAINDLAKAQGEYDQALTAARRALYALSDAGEPYLGRWQPANVQTSPNSEGAFDNNLNTSFPGSRPRFEHVDYQTYSTHEAALSALRGGTVDVILDPAAPAASAAPQVMTSPSRSLRFLVFNLTSAALQDTALRQALACMIDQAALANRLGEAAVALASFVPAEEAFWYDAAATLPCHGLDASARLTKAIGILKAAGYTWAQEPSAAGAGQGLAPAGGKPLGALQLLAPSADIQRSGAAAYVQEQALLLGIPLRTQTVTADAIDFAVFSSHQYDMAVLGWRVSPYPGYLCDWFAVGRPFHYDPSQLTSACGMLNATGDLDAARQQLNQIQAGLAAELPMIPLFSVAAIDAYHNVAYPFAQVLDGLSGVFGAPELAVPAPP